MTHFRNVSKGRRGILLAGGTYAFLNPGETKNVPAHKIKGIPAGLVEVDPAEVPIEGEAEEKVELDLGRSDEDDDDEGLQPVDYPANLVIIHIGDDSEFIVSAPWLAEPESYVELEHAEARQAELREIGPPEGWVDPLDRDENGAPGGSKPAEPPALSGKTKAELTAIAEAEGVTLPTKGTGSGGRVIADDFKTAIEKHRSEQ